ncbi:MAG TPA: biotin--[acetyl-CoA-carboxylase] ligase [Actinomycetota bacterium]|nr:biotin--[acetyl-CoA-carboxylase] ligase [Actinomycetota bacterium]
MPGASEDYAGRVRAALPSFFGPVEVAAALPSTMARAAELAAAGAAEGATVVADAQSAGRGRLGRSWLAAPGTSLLVTVVLRPSLPPARAWLVSAAAGVALADATTAVLAGGGSTVARWAERRRPPSVSVGLKWPNDLEVGGRKVAGMLAEARIDGSRLEWVLLGLGVNVGQGPGDFPPELAGRATSLSLAAGGAVDRVALLAGWAERFAAGYRALAAGAAGPTLAAYQARLGTLGRQVRADLLGGDPVTGVAVGLGANGGLLIRTPAGGEVELASGDVEHLRAGEPVGPVSRRP